MKTKRGNKRSNKVKYGDVDAGLANVRPDEIKVRITTFLDLDVLETLKAQAKEIGMGYQTYLNTFLRETVLNEPGVITRLKRIEKAILGRG